MPVQEVLESITFSFQGGQSLNFAEGEWKQGIRHAHRTRHSTDINFSPPPATSAALVIQGSACVYSKKVEYLHGLVYQALELVADRKVKAIRNKARADGGDNGDDDTDDDEFDEEERFLLIENTLQGALL